MFPILVETPILVFPKKIRKLPIGAIYFRSGGPMPEIYGTDYPEGIFNETAYSGLLVEALNEGKQSGAKHMTYFCDEMHLPIALELGFQCIGKYLCFHKTVSAGALFVTINPITYLCL